MLRALTVLLAAASLTGCIPVLPLSTTLIFLAPGPAETPAEFEARVRQAFSLAQPGTIFEFGEGTFPLTRSLSVSVSHVTIRGQGPSATVLDFSNATDAEAVLATADEFTVRDLGIFDPPSDGVKTVGVDGVTVQNVSVEWPNAADPNNGPYGIYPVLSNNILIEGSYVKGAEDAGIYVGQSSNALVQYNWVEGCVAGIEIENTINAEVRWNVATENTGGILVFDLDGLSQQGRAVSVHHNFVYNNNGPNFGSGFVALVPPGTGILLLTMDEVEIYENEVYDNYTGGIAVLSYEVTFSPFGPTFDAWPETVYVHDNHLTNNGNDPQGAIGQVLSAQFGFGPIPEVMWDRSTNPANLQPDGELPPHLAFCIQNNTGSFGTMLLPPSGDQYDRSLYDCTHPKVPRVVLRDAPLPLPPGQQDLTPEETATLCGANPAGVNWAAYEANCPALSDYNLFAGNDPRGPATERGVFYDLTTPLQSDYMAKYRFVFVPPGQSAAYEPSGVMDFPVGTIISKTFAYDSGAGEVVVETRLLIRRGTGWRALVYIWDAAFTEAVLTPEGGVANITFIHPDGNPRTIDYQIPDHNQCAGCHSGISEPMDLIGPKAHWLNRPDPLAPAVNQLEAWAAAGILAGLPSLATVPRQPDASNPADGTLAERARAYLEANCGHCHRPDGRAGFTSVWLTVETPDGFNTGVCKTPIAAGVGGLQFDIVPGDPDASILLFRMESTVPAVQMPELAKAIAHDEGVALIRDWIAGLPGSCP